MGIRTEQLNNKYYENSNDQAVFTPSTVNLAAGINLLQQVTQVKSGDASAN